MSEPLTVTDIDQIIEGIEHFVMNGDPEVDADWQSYVDKLKRGRFLLAAAPTILAKLEEVFADMACSCRLQPLVNGPVPCPTCQVACVIRIAKDGRQASSDSAQPCGCDPGANWTCEQHRVELGKYVRFHSDSDVSAGYLVLSISRDGMVEIQGYSGLFAKHLFVRVDRSRSAAEGNC